MLPGAMPSSVAASAAANAGRMSWERDPGALEWRAVGGRRVGNAGRHVGHTELSCLPRARTGPEQSRAATVEWRAARSCTGAGIRRNCLSMLTLLQVCMGPSRQGPFHSAAGTPAVLHAQKTRFISSTTANAFTLCSWIYVTCRLILLWPISVTPVPPRSFLLGEGTVPASYGSTQYS